MSIRTYKELSKLDNFMDRFEYLKLDGSVGSETFGLDRWINQNFYTSKEWRRIRDQIIVRDNGCDLGVSGYEINGIIVVHHMNPIRIEDISNCTSFLMNPDYLITVAWKTHQAIHYGDMNLIKLGALTPIERKPYDTCPWKGEK